jgi:hypothetical protein
VTEVVAKVAGLDGPSVITQSTIGTAAASVHDSPTEIGDMSRQFLLDFSVSALSPEFVVRDFSASDPPLFQALLTRVYDCYYQNDRVRVLRIQYGPNEKSTGCRTTAYNVVGTGTVGTLRPRRS